MARKSSNGNSDIIVGTENGSDNNSDSNDGDVITTSESDSNVVESASGDDNQNVITPADIIRSEPDIGDGAGSYTGKRRGRKPGSKNKSGTRSQKENTQDLTSVLVSLHWMAAEYTGIKELELDESEGQKLSKDLLRVQALYSEYIIPEWAIAWGGLLATGAGIYGPRFKAYSMRMKEEAKNKGPQTVNATAFKVS